MFIAATFVVDNKRQVYMSIDPLMLNFFWIMIVEFFEINSLHLYWHRSHYRKRKITFISAFTIQIVHMSWTYIYVYTLMSMSLTMFIFFYYQKKYMQNPHMSNKCNIFILFSFGKRHENNFSFSIVLYNASFRYYYMNKS